MRWRTAARWTGLAMVAAAVAVRSAGAHASGDMDLDIDGARAGLHALIVDMEPVGEYEPLTGCPVVSRNTVVDALETAGVDSPVATFDRVGGPTLEAGNWSAPAVVCSGAFVGSDGDESFPETRVTVTVADFLNEAEMSMFVSARHRPLLDLDATLATPTIGGATFGGCRDVDRHTQCVEYWGEDGFAIGVQIDDRVFVDRATLSAVLVALVPAIVDTLVAVPESDAPVEFEVGSAPVEAARARLADIIDAGGDGSDRCRLMNRTAFESAVDASGLPVETGELRENVQSLDDGDPLDAVGCSSTAGGATVAVVVQDFGDSGSAQREIDLVHGCERAGEVDFCVETWEQDGLAISVVVTASDIERDVVAGLLEALVPVVLDHLAEAAPAVS